MISSVHTGQPLGLYFAMAAKYYYGALVQELKQLEIDRHYTMILILYQSGKPINQQDLGKCMQIDKVSMVRFLDYLENAGMISRSINPGDRREKFIHLTDKGLQAAAKIKKAVKKLNRTIFSGLTEVETEIFLTTLEKVINHMKQLPSRNIIVKYKPGQSEE